VEGLAHELRFVGAAGGLAVLLFPLLLLGLAIPYAVLRLRDSRNPVQDPQLGLKCALYFTHSIGVLLLLTGLTVLVIDFLQELSHQPFRGPGGQGPIFSPVQRTAAALVVSGLVVSFFHLVVIVGFTNNRKWPETRHVFVGWRLAIHSLVMVTAFTALVITLFHQAPDSDTLINVMGTMGVWFPSWLIHLILLHTYRGMGSKPPDEGRPLDVSLVD
jgi:hypothetical protein